MLPQMTSTPRGLSHTWWVPHSPAGCSALVVAGVCKVKDCPLSCRQSLTPSALRPPTPTGRRTSQIAATTRSSLARLLSPTGVSVGAKRLPWEGRCEVGCMTEGCPFTRGAHLMAGKARLAHTTASLHPRPRPADMFHSLHDKALLHATARAVSGEAPWRLHSACWHLLTSSGPPAYQACAKTTCCASTAAPHAP